MAGLGGERRRAGPFGGLAGPALLLALGCAGPPTPLPPEVAAETERLQDLSLDHWIARVVRVQEVAQRLQIAGRDLCAHDESPRLGISVWDAEECPPGLDAAVMRRFGDEGIYVVGVFPEMAGARAGLRPGDQILSVDGELRGIEDVYRPRTPAGQPVQLEVRRGEEELSLQVEHVAGCGFPVYLSLDEDINAWTDGSNVYIHAGLARQLERDADLAYVVGHELAHDIHMASGVQRRRIRGGRQRIEAESKADYVGIYLSAMAGYPIYDDPAVYVTITTNVNSLGHRSRTHPLTHARSLLFAKTLEEIERKRSLGEPLEPSVQ